MAKYTPMGLNGTASIAVVQPTRARVDSVAPASPSRTDEPPSKSSGSRCCFGVLSTQRAALLIALLELAFFSYHVVSASLAYNKTGDEYAFAFTLTLFCFALALLAVGLLLAGIKRESPYFLLPHLLLQFAMLTSTFLMGIYVVMLLVGGTSVKVEAIFYEDSARGELGLTQASRLTPFKTSVITHELNTMLITTLLAAIIFFLLQAWFLLTVNRLFTFLREKHMNGKPPPNNNNGTVTSKGLPRHHCPIGDENCHMERIRNGTNL